jgi:putative transposase
VCLRFVFLLAVQIPAWLRLSRRPPTWKDAEILLLRHQLAVLQRQTAARPKLRWTDRALFAALLTLIPRSCHGALHLFITPGTILRWHRDIVRRRWAAKSKPKRPGRPPTHRRIVRLVLRMAADNEHWGYRRIAGELAGLGIAVAPSTVWEILKRHDIDPAPRRSGPGWAQFLRSQAEAILALDLFTVDLLDGTKAYVLAAIEHATRRIRILGATAHPGGQWIVQQARNLCMDLDQAGANVKFVLHDRDAIFHEGFDTAFTAAGLRIVRSGVRVPRMNSIMERWIGGCRRELLDRTLIWNLPHLRRILAACERHHNDHRPHMALSSAAPLKPLPAEITDLEAFRILRRDRAGGVIHEYQHAV